VIAYAFVNATFPLHHRTDLVAVLEVASEDFRTQRIEQQVLNGTLQGTCSEDGIVAFVGEFADHFVADGEGDVLLAPSGR